MIQRNNWKRVIVYLTIIILFTFIINGCARWPDDPNGGNGIEQKLLTIRVDINSTGVIDTNNGYYYIVFDTNENALSPPDDNIDDWEDDYYYIRLDEYGFYFGEVGTTQEEYIGNIPSTDNYFQITVNFDKLGDPEKVFMNVITTDRNDEAYDYMNDASSLTISDTDFVPYNNIVSDFQQDSLGGVNFDIAQATVTILVP
ncbi:MAG: hypothetical protein APR54_11870 [Candidatus Cloacimonas sp. SDB]|nr:MAG: hypothetical protein APR54_11870 [Candidatus Cloacimonas sp. SDB]